MENTQQAFEAAASAAVASKVTQAGAAASVASWFLSSEFGVLAGLAIGLAGLFMNWHYRRKEYRLHEQRNAREQAEHDRRMQQQPDKNKP